MTIDLAAAALVPASSSGGAAAPMQVGYGVSLTDLGGFQRALEGAFARLETRPDGSAPDAAARRLMMPLEHINGEAAQLAQDARAAQASGAEMRPADVVMLTVRCQEFMFHCQLTANIANRTSDGLQQLFRQQA